MENLEKQAEVRAGRLSSKPLSCHAFQGIYMTDVDQVIDIIDEIISSLSNPLTDDDISGGWTEEAKLHYYHLFLDLKSNLISKSSDPWPTQFARGLDYWGIINGDLHERIMLASTKLREIENEIRNPLNDID
jgi:hypothetical protein